MRTFVSFLLLTLGFLATAWGQDSRDQIIVHCQPKAVEIKVKIKAYYWKNEIEKRWCQGTRSSRYPLVVSCTPGTVGNSHLTTFTFDTPLLVNQAKVDLDPSAEEVWDKGLPHALAHAILPSCFPGTVPVLDIPAWILEGLAESTHESLWRNFELAFGKAGRHGFIKLEDLLFTESRELSFLTQSGLLVTYLANEIGGTRQFIQFVSQLGFNQAPQKSIEALGQYVRTFKAVYGLTLTEIEEGFLRYVDKQTASPEKKLPPKP